MPFCASDTFGVIPSECSRAEESLLIYNRDPSTPSDAFGRSG